MTPQFTLRLFLLQFLLHNEAACTDCPSFSSTVEEGSVVCPGAVVIYTCSWPNFSGYGSSCYTATNTLTASLELNGTVTTCEDDYGETIGTATLLVYSPPSPVLFPTQNPSTDTLTSTTIKWSVPGDSGADITSYTISYTSESGEGVESVDGSATSALLTGLTPNVDYKASITASNCAGTSEPTAFSFRILISGPPSPNGTKAVVVCNKSQIVLSWMVKMIPHTLSHPPPPSPSPVYVPVEAVWVNYTVEKEEGAATSEMSSGPLPPSTESFVIENATLGANYTVVVLVVNQLGWSESVILSFPVSACIEATEMSPSAHTEDIPNGTTSLDLQATPFITKHDNDILSYVSSSFSPLPPSSFPSSSPSLLSSPSPPSHSLPWVYIASIGAFLLLSTVVVTVGVTLVLIMCHSHRIKKFETNTLPVGNVAVERTEGIVMEENSAYSKPVIGTINAGDVGVKTKENSAYAGARPTKDQEPVYEEITDFSFTHNSAYGCHGHGAFNGTWTPRHP